MPWVVLAGLFLVLVVIVVWADGRPRSVARRAHRLDNGTQEMRVVVQRGYHPARIDLEAGIPTTLRFDRREDDPCTEMLVSELWPTAHRLVAHAETEVRFTPERVGRFIFTCGMGLYSGELLIHEARGK